MTDLPSPHEPLKGTTVEDSFEAIIRLVWEKYKDHSWAKDGPATLACAVKSNWGSYPGTVRFTRGDTLFHPDGREEHQVFGRLGDTTIQVAGPVRTPHN